MQIHPRYENMSNNTYEERKRNYSYKIPIKPTKMKKLDDTIYWARFE